MRNSGRGKGYGWSRIGRKPMKHLKLEEYTNLVRDRVFSDRWVVYDPQHDPCKNQRASLILEMDKTTEGELRIKRCVKIFDDRTYQVLIDNVDMTSEFEINTSKRLETTQDSDNLIHALTMKKLCQGVPYEPKNPVLTRAKDLPIKQRGKSWYARDCAVILTKGNSCESCSQVGMKIRRRLQTDRRKQSRAPKTIKSTIGKAVYALLNDLSGRGRFPRPSYEYAKDSLVYHEKRGIYELQYAASTRAMPSMSLDKSGNFKNPGTSGRKRKPRPSSITSGGQGYQNIQQFVTEDGQLCYVADVVDHNGGSSDFQYGMPMMVEKYEAPDMNGYVTLDDGNIIQIQNLRQGQEFALGEGQKYELIGEAASTSTSSMEIYPADNQQIKIVEVDDATMEQIEVHESTEDMQIASVDPNDPNLSELFRAFQSQIQGLEL